MKKQDQFKGNIHILPFQAANTERCLTMNIHPDGVMDLLTEAYDGTLLKLILLINKKWFTLNSSTCHDVSNWFIVA